MECSLPREHTCVRLEIRGLKPLSLTHISVGTERPASTARLPHSHLQQGLQNTLDPTVCQNNTTTCSSCSTEHRAREHSHCRPRHWRGHCLATLSNGVLLSLFKLLFSSFQLHSFLSNSPVLGGTELSSCSLIQSLPPPHHSVGECPRMFGFRFNL